MAYRIPTVYGDIEFADEVPREVAQEYIRRKYEGYVPETNVLRDLPASLVSGIGSLLEFPGTLYGLAGGDPDNILSKAGKATREFAADTLASEGFQEQRAEVEARLAELEGEDISKQITGTLGEIATNPYYMLNLGVEQIPQLAGGLGLGYAAKKGITKAAEKAGKDIAEDAIQKRGNRAARATTIGTFAGLQGADVARNTYDDIMALPDETFLELPEFQELVNRGLTAEEAKEEIAVRQARESFLKAASLSTITAAALPSTLEKTVFGGIGKQGFLKGALKGGIGEAAQEAAEEGGGAIISGFDVQDIDPSRDPYSRAGIAGTLGGTLGFGFGAGAGGISGLNYREPPPEADLEAMRAIEETSGMAPLAGSTPLGPQQGQAPFSPFRGIVESAAAQPTVEYDALEKASRQPALGQQKELFPFTTTVMPGEEDAQTEISGLKMKPLRPAEEKITPVSEQSESDKGLESETKTVIDDDFLKRIGFSPRTKPYRDLKGLDMSKPEDQVKIGNVIEGIARNKRLKQETKQKLEEAVNNLQNYAQVKLLKQGNLFEEGGQDGGLREDQSQRTRSGSDLGISNESAGGGDPEGSSGGAGEVSGVGDVDPEGLNRYNERNKRRVNSLNLEKIPELPATLTLKGDDFYDAADDFLYKHGATRVEARDNALRAVAFELGDPVEPSMVSSKRKDGKTIANQQQVAEGVKNNAQKLYNYYASLGPKTAAKLEQYLNEFKGKAFSAQQRAERRASVKSEEELLRLRLLREKRAEKEKGQEITEEELAEVERQVEAINEEKDRPEAEKEKDKVEQALERIRETESDTLAKMRATAKSLSERDSFSVQNGQSETIEDLLTRSDNEAKTPKNVTISEFIKGFRKQVAGTEYETLLDGIVPYLKKAKIKLYTPDAKINKSSKDLISTHKPQSFIEYDPNTGQSTIYLNSQQGESKVGSTPLTVMHELVHAATIDRVHVGRIHAKKDFTSVLGSTYKKVNETMLKLRERVGVIHKEGGKVPSQFLDKKGNLKENFVGTALENVDEFIAYGFTDKQIQDFLRTTSMASLGLPIREGEIGPDRGSGFANLFTRFVNFIGDFLGLRVALRSKFYTKVAGKDILNEMISGGDKRRRKTYNMNALEYLLNQTGNFMAYGTKKIDSMKTAALPDQQDLNPISRAIASVGVPIQIIGADGGIMNVGGQQENVVQTNGGIGQTIKALFQPSKKTVDDLIFKFVNDRVHVKSFQEELQKTGKIRFGDEDFNNIYTQITGSMGLAESDFNQFVMPLEKQMEEGLNRLTKIYKQDSKIVMQHIGNLFTAFHEAERRRVKYIRTVNLTKENNQRRAQILSEIDQGTATEERARELRAELDNIVNNDAKARTQDINGENFDVSSLSHDQVTEILAQHSASPLEVQEEITKLQEVVRQLNETTIKFNQGANYWTAPVNAMKAFYGWQNYVPLKGRPENEQDDEVLNFSGRRIGGELQDAQNAFTGRVSEAENPLVRSLVEASQGSLRKHKLPITEAVKNAVQQKLLPGEVTFVTFADRQTKNALENYKNPENIFHYMDDGSVAVIRIKDEKIRESIRRTYRESQPLLDTLNNVTSFLGQTHTRYNINFPALNYIRDLLTNSFILGAEFGPKETVRLLGDVATDTHSSLHKTWKFASLFNAGKVEQAQKLADKDPFYKELVEYIGAGGRVAYMRGLTSGSQMADFQHVISDKGVKTAIGKTKQSVDKFFDNWMDTFELTARTLVYRRMKGIMQKRNPELQGEALNKEAAAYTKNLANFEQSGEYGRTMGALFMFFRPSVTGALRSLEAIMKGPHGGTMALTLLGVGASMYLMAAALSAEDEEGRNSLLNDDLTRWTRYARFHITDDFVMQFPFGFGNGGLMAVGAQLMGLFLSNNTTGEVLENIARIGMESYLPLPISQISPFENFTGFLADSMAPSAARPLVQHAMNLNGLGYTIYPSSYNRYSDAYSGNTTTPEMFTSLAREIFDATDGQVDVSPNSLYFFANSYADGFSKLLGMADSTVRLAMGNKSFEPKQDTPFFGSFMSKPSNVDGKQYAKMERKILDMQKRYNVAKGDPDRLKKFIRNNPDDMKMLGIYNTLSNRVLRNHRAQKNRIARDPRLNARERKEKLDQIKDLINNDKRIILQQILNVNPDFI